MRARTATSLLARRLVPAALVASALASLARPSPADEAAAHYLGQVKPLLKARCYACHGALQRKAGLRLDTGAAILEGGDGGPAVEPGHADESLLIERIIETDPKLRMPPEGEPLTPEQVATLRAWVERGAPSPADETPEPDPRAHWSFRVPTRPELPASTPGGHPVDAFVDAEMARRGLSPLPRAEPHALLRRVHLDLTGLPPTRDDLRAFLADPSDAAYERVVDRLLASPAHGERWARHWMDVWRYSDWYGRRAVPDVLNSYAMIWRWRDWIVRSLNEDRGYDRMVVEMLAADEVAPGDDAKAVAAGYLVRNFYRWNYNSWMKDNVEHTAKAFLGLTLQCAHCHDHKYDPLTHEDYFRFRAFFEPLEIRHDRVPGEPDPGPYPKYTYGAAYAPIKSGLVRVVDEKLDAQTFLYTKGESRNVVPGRPPIPPGVPGFLAPHDFQVEPVELPAEVSYPGLRDFVRREETEKRAKALADAEQTLTSAKTKALDAERTLAAIEAPLAAPPVAAFADRPLLAFAPSETPSPVVDARQALAVALASLDVDSASILAARLDRESLRARIAADDAKYGRSSGDPKTLSRAASKAERVHATAAAAIALAKARRDAVAARAKGGPELAKAEQAATAAVAALEAARTAEAGESETYTALSPVYPTKSTGRRSALARWMVAPSNPLTARVAVNHLWRWHFGSALVPTVDDFGRNGKPPTHPALLDWLAVELREPSDPLAIPWSMKRLHRLIVTSEAYKRSSRAESDHPGRSLDPANSLYWKAQTGRMEAEVVRDSLLHVAGELDPAIGGPDIDQAQGLTSRRRSLYVTHHGETRMTFLALFDAPDPIECYRRTVSIVPQQALALVNNDLALAMSRSLAAKLGAAADGDEAFAVAAFEQVLSRPPTDRERDVAVAFLRRQAEQLRGEPAEGVDPAARSREDLVLALLNHNDFVTIR